MLLQLDLITTVVYCFFIMLCVKTLDKNNLIFFHLLMEDNRLTLSLIFGQRSRQLRAYVNHF